MSIANDHGIMVCLERVSRIYRDGDREVRALADIDLTIRRGETVALAGSSGSGKSTLLHLIGGLEWPSTGRVTVAGQALHLMSDAALTRFRRTHIGFVFQFFHLLPALSVEENLIFPAEMSGWSGKAARRRAHRLAEELGISAHTSAFPDRLSGGEQQRVAIARSLMLDPPLLMADEPTGNLDSETGGVVLDILFRAARERGTTLLLATHSTDAARRAGRRIELHDGRIAADTGNPVASRGSAAEALAETGDA